MLANLVSKYIYFTIKLLPFVSIEETIQLENEHDSIPLEFHLEAPINLAQFGNIIQFDT
jgi:hypothetical protein